MIRIATDAGFQVGTHATGDATIDAVVAGYLAAKQLGATRTLAELASLHGDSLREPLRAALRAVANDASDTKIELTK